MVFAVFVCLVCLFVVVWGGGGGACKNMNNLRVFKQLFLLDTYCFNIGLSVQN